MIAKAFLGLAFLIAVLGASLFGPAWSFDYWQAWVFLAVFSLEVLAITIYLALRDPALLARRTQAGPIAEREGRQKILQSIASLAFLTLFIVAAFDHRDGWSRVPVALVALGELLVTLGLGVVFLVFRANTFTSATIEVSRDQQVVSTGPYAVVRHPMYAGALVMIVGIPLALGSWCALVAVPVLTAVIVGRLVAEEELLVASLAGYPEYRSKVTHRLVPHLW